jgi:methyltransferase (TIGR00027 family)
MRDKQSSKTAEGIAIMRAIESSKPEDVRLFYDPFARRMVNGFSLFCSKMTINSGLYGMMWAGAQEFVIARERYIDDFLKACLEESFKQVVILGAGFDMRAFRIDGIDRVRVFEVDHPATQAAKLKKLRRIFDEIPKHVEFISVDFNKQTLEERLLAGEYSEHEKTVFIWQGVTMYLTPEAVDSTLRFIAEHSAKGSAVAFDYFYKDALEGNSALKLARNLLKLMGEQLDFGINEGQLEPFLQARGFENVHSASSDEMTKLYFANTERKVAQDIAIGTAKVR